MILINEFTVFCIIYAFIGFLILYADLSVSSKSEKIQALIYIYMLPCILVITPIYILVKSIGVLVGYNKHKRCYFTIHKLTTKNKNTLLEMGFEYGEFINENNINYKGYRYNNGRIVVLSNGRVNYAFNLSDEENVIIELIKKLPDTQNI
jgi:hypothetical protein